MSLEEEIAIYQFAQGVRSVQAMLDSFNQLDGEKRYWRLFDLFSLVRESQAVPSDAEQALAEGPFDPSYIPCVRLKTKGLNVSIMNVPEADLTQDYTFLLYLVKATYQRRSAVDKENPTRWWYQDLSNSHVVKGLLTMYDELVEELYNSPSYRNEFSSIAKLWHEYTLLREVKKPEANFGFDETKKYHFITYDEMREQCATWAYEPSKYIHPMWTLRHSLEKGLAKRYKLDRGLVSKLVSAVIERHLRETYNTSGF